MLSDVTSTPWGQGAVGAAFFIGLSLVWVYVTRVLRPWINQYLEHATAIPIKPLLERFVKLLRIWGFLAIAYFALEVAGFLAPNASSLLEKLVFGTLIVLSGASVTEGVARIVGHSLEIVGTPRSLTRFSQVVALLSFSYLTLLILLAVVEVSITPLLGIGTVAAIPLLLVLQDAASDLFFYFRLMRRQHLRVGDFIRLESGISGHVAAITWQDVRIRTPANNLVVIPNRRMSRMIVTNYHLPDKRGSLTLPILVTQGPSHEVIESILMEELKQAVQDLPGLAPDALPEIKRALGKSGEGASFIVFYQVEDLDLTEGLEREVLKRIALRFKREEIQSPILDSLLEDQSLTRPSKSSQDLHFLVESKLKDTRFIAASNREPYIHTFEGKSIRWQQPASGMSTALDPVMKVLGGVWVAVASGNADRDVSDPQGLFPVPPDKPAYTLRRLWLNKEQEELYYYGFSNSTLWPLCHTVYIRPSFEIREWKAYRDVNHFFAKAILEEARGKRAFVFLQDYHLALVPKLLREAGAEVTVAHFWHVPWPSTEVFQTCPWAGQLLEGLLGNDLLGFHTRYHCNNFLETVDKTLECRVDYGKYSVTRNNHQTLVRPFPISIDFEAISEGVTSAAVERERKRFLQELGVANGPIGISVDRLDYTKGIPERLKAIDRFLDLHPDYKGKFTFIQVGVPSRSQIREYREVDDEVQHLVEEINWRHRSGPWQPIIYLRRYFSSTPLNALYSLADFCIVSSLHDGMNLVAKEYVAAQATGKGVLILSKFTGAATELADALLINPYDIESFANTIAQAIEMPVDQKIQRMKRMRAYVQENDVYRWAIRILTELARVESIPYEPMPR